MARYAIYRTFDKQKMNSPDKSEFIKYIDIDKVFKTKNPKLYRALPPFVFTFIKWVLIQNWVNKTLNDLKPYKGYDFFDQYNHLPYVQNKLVVTGLEKLPKDRKFIFASNHPYGGPDGIALIAAIGKFSKDLRFIVNDLLLNLPNTEPIFLPVNKLGANTREYLQVIEDAYKSDNHMLIFPSGMVSRKIDGEITDTVWLNSFIKKARQHKRDVVPVHIEGRNSKSFYIVAGLRKLLGIKTNLEMFLLPRQLRFHTKETIRIHIGEPIPYSTFDRSKTPDEWALHVRKLAYELAKD